MATRILQVAIRTEDGLIHTLPRPARHGDLINPLFWLNGDPNGGEHGFLLDDGSFVDRTQAWPIAEAAGQISPTARKREAPYLHLFSEDVW